MESVTEQFEYWWMEVVVHNALYNTVWFFFFLESDSSCHVNKTFPQMNLVKFLNLSL